MGSSCLKATLANPSQVIIAISALALSDSRYPQDLEPSSPTCLKATLANPSQVIIAILLWRSLTADIHKTLSPAHPLA